MNTTRIGTESDFDTVYYEAVRDARRASVTLDTPDIPQYWVFNVTLRDTMLYGETVSLDNKDACRAAFLNCQRAQAIVKKWIPALDAIELARIQVYERLREEINHDVQTEGWKVK